MRRVSLLAVLSLVVIAGSGSPPSSGSGGPRWSLLQGCALQNFVGVAVNDRSDVIAYLEECVDAGTGAIYAPASYFLAGPDGWVTFGPHGIEHAVLWTLCN